MDRTLKQLTDLRSRAFDMANSGKHGEYPIDMEEFNTVVEEGFNDNGTTWTALDGTVLKIHKFFPKDVVKFIGENHPPRKYMVTEVLDPGEKLYQAESRYPGWSIRGYVNNTDEPVCIIPDNMCGITFAAKESEIELY